MRRQVLSLLLLLCSIVHSSDMTDVSEDFFFKQIFPKTIPNFRIRNEVFGRVRNGESHFMIDDFISVETTGSLVTITNAVTQTSAILSRDTIADQLPWPEDPADEIDGENYRDWQLRQQWEHGISRKYQSIRSVLREKKVREYESLKKYTGQDGILNGEFCLIEGVVSGIRRAEKDRFVLRIQAEDSGAIDCVLDAEATNGLMWLRLGDRIKVYGRYNTSSNVFSHVVPLSINNTLIYTFIDLWSDRSQEMLELCRLIQRRHSRHPWNRGNGVIYKSDGTSNTTWIDVALLTQHRVDIKELGIALAMCFMFDEGAGIPCGQLRNARDDSILLEITGVRNIFEDNDYLREDWYGKN